MRGKSLKTKTICHVSQISGFRSYVDLYLKDKVDEIGNALNVVHEIVNERWEVCITMSEKGFQQVSFVNSIATTKVSSQCITSFQVPPGDLMSWPLFQTSDLINKMSVGTLSTTFLILILFCQVYLMFILD